MGDELRYIRELRSLSLRELSEISYVSYSYLSELERGKKEFSSETFESICRALNVRMSDVLKHVSKKMDIDTT